MTGTRSVKAAVRSASPQVREYVAALEAENRRLHKQVAKLEVKAKSQENRSKVLEKQINKYRKSGTVEDLMAEIAKRGRPSLDER